MVAMVVVFFQAGDGIRDLTVTGVQTCALPIYVERAAVVSVAARGPAAGGSPTVRGATPHRAGGHGRTSAGGSEGGCGGKGGRTWWAPVHLKKKNSTYVLA